MLRKKGKGTLYRIVVRSELSDRYASAFEGMEMQTKNGQTILSGEVKDQPHLFGILERLNSLGLELLSVQAFSEDAHPIAEVMRAKATNRDPNHLTGEAYSPNLVEGAF
jgi:hypothetical protein